MSPIDYMQNSFQFSKIFVVVVVIVVEIRIAAKGALTYHLPGKSKMANRGLQNGQWGLEMSVFLGFWALMSNFAG